MTARLDRDSIIALIATAAASLAVVVILMLWHLALPEPHTQKQPLMADSELDTEEYLEVEQLIIPAPADPDNNPGGAPAVNETVEHNASEEAPAPGMDAVNAGPVATTPVTPAPQTTQRPSPHTAKPVTPQPTPAEIAAARERERQEAQRKQIDNAMGGAFAATGTNNTNADGKKPGNSGNPAGTPGVTNSGTRPGSISIGGSGKGWKLPTRSSVTSKDTGKLTFRVSVDPSGKGTYVSHTGTDKLMENSRLIAAIRRELETFKYTLATSTPATEPVIVEIIYNIR